MKCRKCGREIPNDSIYCIFCGVRLNIDLLEDINDFDDVIDLDKIPNYMEDIDDVDRMIDEFKKKNKLKGLEKILFNKVSGKNSTSTN